MTNWACGRWGLLLGTDVGGDAQAGTTTEILTFGQNDGWVGVGALGVF